MQNQKPGSAFFLLYQLSAKSATFLQLRHPEFISGSPGL